MKKKRVIIALSILIVSIVLIIAIPTVAKYVTDRIKSYYLRSKNFYFTSDLLDTNNSTYQIGTWSGVGNFDVTFKLFSKDNDYLFSESDIDFDITATVSTGATYTLNKTHGVLYANDNDHEDSVILTVIPSRVFLADQQIQIDVTATSSAPYVKALKATFIYIVGREGVSYEVEDETNRTYMMLKVINDIDYCTVTQAFGTNTVSKLLTDAEYRELSPSEKTKCISQYIDVAFDSDDLLVDNTSPVMDYATYTTVPKSGINYIENLHFAIAPNSTVAIKFYKIDTSMNYTYPRGNSACIATVTASNPTLS